VTQICLKRGEQQTIKNQCKPVESKLALHSKENSSRFSSHNSSRFNSHSYR